MASWEKWLWGGLGWSIFGPLGGIVGFALGSMTDNRGSGSYRKNAHYPRTRPGDFGVSMMVLLAAVMRADEKLLKSELEFVKKFLVQTFGADHSQDLMVLFKDILDQEYPLRDVCAQIKRHMDHPARLEMVHVLFGLALADRNIDPSELEVISTISGYLGISSADFDSIQAMFMRDSGAPYRILEVDSEAGQEAVKRAYRKMANKYHPDKVAHLGEDFGVVAEEKFKAINDAYARIKVERGWE